MGVLPLQFADGDSWESLGLDGSERIEIRGLDDGLNMNDELTVVAERDDGSTVEFPVTAQVGTPAAVRYVKNDGILHLVLRRLLTEE
jgi:aconitate hydratase